MASPSPSAPEKAPKKPTVTESVEDFISRKKSERSAEGASAVQQSAEGVQREVADVMAGMEKPKEGISEKGEKKGESKGGGSGAGQASAAQTFFSDEDWKSFVFPDEEVMIKHIRTAITLQIKIEMKKAKRLQKNITTGGAQEYNVSISRIRRLQIILASLFTATVDYMKGLYKKYFRPDGRQRNPEEVGMD